MACFTVKSRCKHLANPIGSLHDPLYKLQRTERSAQLFTKRVVWGGIRRGTAVRDLLIRGGTGTSRFSADFALSVARKITPAQTEWSSAGCSLVSRALDGALHSDVEEADDVRQLSNSKQAYVRR